MVALVAMASIEMSAPFSPSSAPSRSRRRADDLLAGGLGAALLRPTLRTEVEASFTEAPAATLDIDVEHDKGHGRIEERRVSVIRQVDWLAGDRRFPGELRLPDVACIICVETSARLADKDRSDTRYFISSANLTARQAAEAVRGHWAIENRLHWCSTSSSAKTNPASEKATAPNSRHDLCAGDQASPG